jgi:hypothetical protein
MIHYQLRCAGAHEFDGWFQNAAAFETQAARGLLECPVCGATDVARALMAPALARAATPAPAATAQRGEAKPAEAKPAREIAVHGTLPAQVLAGLQRLRAEIEAHSDNVGPRFAEEARRIHNGKSAPRSIHGEATAEQAERLAEDGIPVLRIPWVPRADG